MGAGSSLGGAGACSETAVSRGPFHKRASISGTSIGSEWATEVGGSAGMTSGAVVAPPPSPSQDEALKRRPKLMDSRLPSETGAKVEATRGAETGVGPTKGFCGLEEGGSANGSRSSAAAVDEAVEKVLADWVDDSEGARRTGEPEPASSGEVAAAYASLARREMEVRR